ncbi:MAG TPA: D-aminoacyl-tRNA deacylase [Burkholderiales bacterium]|nr:D-aminoacyl-tRNA deacylase [Burkholderiales bacterium]
MIALVQRVSGAKVAVDGVDIASIGHGILALVGVQRGDGPTEAARLAERVLAYRIFADGQGKMNLSLKDIGGELLAVPQFTLAADTNSGLRPSFSNAAAPADGETLFLKFVEKAAESIHVASGRFGADMKVSLLNDGPVTFWLEVLPRTS